MFPKPLIRVLTALACLALAPVSARSSDPSSGTIDATTASVSWSGGPLPGAGGVYVQCQVAQDARCDNFALTADSASDRPVSITITPQPAADEYALFVYDDLGLEVAASTGEGAREIHFVHKAGRKTYRISVQTYSDTGGATYEGAAGWVPEIDAENDCLQLVPQRAGVKGVTDDGRQITLDIRVLLDGVTQTRAADAVARAQTSYAPLGITIAATYEPVTFTGTEATGLIQQAKDRFGGRRPDGVDVVYTMTKKDMTSNGDNSVAGLADCIGGVSAGDTAFAVGEAIGEGGRFIAFDTVKYGDAKVMAHEVAHLLGAHHHYGNCVEGEVARERENGPAPCTLMFIDVFLITQQFSTVNGAMVRANAVQFAQRPN